MPSVLDFPQFEESRAILREHSGMLDADETVISTMQQKYWAVDVLDEIDVREEVVVGCLAELHVNHPQTRREP
jgi:hypothetical protein